MKSSPQAALALQIKAMNLPEPVWEYVFAKPRKFAFDAAWPNFRTAVEIEGGMFGVGQPCRSCGRRRVAGHSSIQRILTDISKYNLAAEGLWSVYRFTPQMIKDGDAIKILKRVLG